MIPVEEMHHHPTGERLVDILCTRVETDNPEFFRAVVAYYFCMVSASMRCEIATHDRGATPINAYTIALGPSGIGKTRTVNVMENEVLHQFLNRFQEETFPLSAEDNMPKLAHKRASRSGTDPDDELAKAETEFNGCGSLMTTFDSGSAPALKQMRHKMLMAQAGSLNLQIDEIGDNLLNNVELINVYLEMFDMGIVKDKITKQTADNKRVQQIIGRVPGNALLFGVPMQLLDGAKVEEEFYAMLQKGYARRCIFAYGHHQGETVEQTPEEIYDRITDQTSFNFIDDLADQMEQLADLINLHKKLLISKELTLENIQYKQWCERRAAELPEHEAIRKTELVHRHFKALKLAGAYAFVDQSPEIFQHHLHAAIKLVEESGEALNQVLTRDRNYVKLARYIADINKEVTQPDLIDDLPFYPKAANQRNELMNLAIAYGYKHNIIIKKRYDDGVEFIRGESLKPTQLEKMYLSYSNDIVEDYQNTHVAFEDLSRLAEVGGMHWVNHHLKGGYRNEENSLPGFNLIVIDVDGGVNLSTARMLLKDYKYFLQTTKRHTDDEHRFRIIFPTNYELRLDAADYKEFMSNVYQSLPFNCDDGTNQRSRKWLTTNGHHEFNEGELFDVLPFIPKTSKNEDRKQLIKDQQQLDNLERWVINTTGDGNRNNQLLKYAYILVDAGFDYDAVYSRVTELNTKLPDKLEEVELINTVMVTIGKALAKRAA